MDSHARYLKQAEESIKQDARIKAWFQLRVQNIHKHITVYDILRSQGVDLHGDDREHQVACPFHGPDKKPSARVYPAQEGTPAAMWCFVCQERWDAISLWKKYHDETLPFAQVLASIERDFSIPTPEPPKMPVGALSKRDIPEDVQKLANACTNRLRAEKGNLQMMDHLLLGILIDRTLYLSRIGKLSHQESLEHFRLILDKIGEKIRAAYDEDPDA